MKLRFLGQAYTALDNSVETIVSKHTAQFLGRTYMLRRPANKINSASGVSKKYRGVTY
ncbi:MAG: DUF4278 domain-containing protein [Cyanobacteria bacterium J06621_8]